MRKIPSSRACWGMFAVAAFLCVTSSTAIAGVEVLVPPNNVDDTNALQAQLNLGRTVRLQPLGRYRISRRLDVTKNDSGIITIGTPATIEIAMQNINRNAFTEFCLKGDPDCPVVANDGSIAIHAENVTDLRLENFKLEKRFVDGSYVSGIWLRGVTRGKLVGLDLSGFSLGAIIAIDSVREVAIRGCNIHDSWASTASTQQDPKENRFPQLTGIWFDDNRMRDPKYPNDPTKRVASTDVVVANNTISKLRFKQSLFQTPRNRFAGMESLPDTNIVEYQTDGITVGPPTTRVKIIANVIDRVGEGIDCMGKQIRIEENRISNAYGGGLKFIHGASNNIAYRNTLGAAGSVSIGMAGSADDGVTDSFGNLIRENEITKVGDRSAYCFGADPGFMITDSRGACPESNPGIAVDIGVTPKAARFPYLNLVQGNKIKAVSSDHGMKHLFRAEARASYSLFYGNVFTNETGRCTSDVADPTNLCIDNLFDPAAVGTEFDPSADRLAVGDVDANGKNDFFVHWSASGQNRLYRDISDTTSKVAISPQYPYPPPLPWAAISGSPDLLSGDFNGDTRMDLLAYWKQTGINRIYYGTAAGGFTERWTPIPTGAVNGSPDSVVTGDFNGDKRTDLLFYWKQTGTNRFYYGTTSGFTGAEDPIPTGAVNGSPDSVVTGDFNGDKRTDLLFYWKQTGTNRFYYGTATLGFTEALDPISPAGVNGSPDRVLSFDANLDGRDDLDFFWHATGQRRLCLGQQNGSFVAE